MRVVDIESSFHKDAQISALHRVFTQEGWRKATALNAEIDTEPA
ncbi:MAG: hypothetical protein ACRDFX_06580 [Chloroflexota bacterium]